MDYLYCLTFLCVCVCVRPGEGKVHWPSSPIRNVGAADMLDEE